MKKSDTVYAILIVIIWAYIGYCAGKKECINNEFKNKTTNTVK